MQVQYPMLAKVEVEMTQEKEMDELPNRPSKFLNYLHTYLHKYVTKRQFLKTFLKSRATL